MPCTENEEILKTIEKLIIGNITCPGNIQRGDIYDSIMDITGSIISSFLNVIKANVVDVELVCSLFFNKI